MTGGLTPLRDRAPGARPKVCVALPVLDAEAYFAQAIDSVLAQEGVDLEVRVLDNGSRDLSPRLARAYAEIDARVVFADNPFDLTYYGSLNRALAETDAEYFVPFAADDVMYPDNLRRKVVALEETGAALAGSSADMIEADGTPTDRLCPDHRETPRLTEAPHFFRRLVPANAMSCQAVVSRTAALREVGGFDVRSYYAADWLAWMRLALRHAVVILPEPLIANREHTRTITQTGSAAGLNARDVPATLDHAFDDAALPAEWAELRPGAVASSHRFMAAALTHAGMLRAAQGWAAYAVMLRAVAASPGDVDLQQDTRHQIAAAGLWPVTFPCEAVAEAPQTEADAAGLARAAGELGPLVGRLVLRVSSAAVQDALALLAPHFADTDLDVLLAPDVDAARLQVGGRLALAPWGSDGVASAEAAGLPVYPYNLPNPFAAVPDPARWQTLPAARAAA